MRVDARTGDIARVFDGVEPSDLPVVLDGDEPAPIAASGDFVAWTSGDRLFLRTESGTIRLVAEHLPVVAGHAGSQVRVGVGDRLLSWSSSPVDGDPARSQGLLVDLSNGEAVAVSGEVWASGPWVVWSSQDGYHFARTG